MLRRILLGLSVLQALAITGVSATESSDVANIRTMRVNALQLCATGQVDDGLHVFENAIGLAEKTFGKESSYVADLCFDAGVAALRTDRYPKAEHCLAKAVALKPNGTEARLKLAEYYRIKGKYNEAKTQLSKVLSQDPQNVHAHEQLALTYDKEGNAAKATEQCAHLDDIISGRAAPVQLASAMMPSVRPTPPPLANPINVRAAAQPKPEAATPAPAPTEPAKPATTAPAAAKPPAQPAIQAPPPPANKGDRKAIEKWLQQLKHQKELREQAAKKKAEIENAAKKKKQHGDKHDRKPAAHKAAPAIETGMMGVQERIRAEAKLLTKVKKPATAATTELIPAGTEPVVSAPKPVPKPRRGLVPPPPPVVPVFGMPAAVPPPPQPRPPAPTGPKLQERKPMEDPDGGSESHSSSGGGDDDADFLLDWAGKKKKKGK
jgi:tetratricopeptide (TPR) repeat protein